MILFVRDDPRYFDGYIPGKSKGDSLPGPSFMNNNIGIWGGANDGKPGELYWKEKVDGFKAVVGCGQAVVQPAVTAGLVVTGHWKSAFTSLLSDLAGLGTLLRNEPLLERKPVLRR